MDEVANGEEMEYEVHEGMNNVEWVRWRRTTRRNEEKSKKKKEEKVLKSNFSTLFYHAHILF